MDRVFCVIILIPAVQWRRGWCIARKRGWGRNVVGWWLAPMCCVRCAWVDFLPFSGGHLWVAYSRTLWSRVAQMCRRECVKPPPAPLSLPSHFSPWYPGNSCVIYAMICLRHCISLNFLMQVEAEYGLFVVLGEGGSGTPNPHICKFQQIVMPKIRICWCYSYGLCANMKPRTGN